MHKYRLEAFSDGVMAVLLTILVLELKIPHGTEFKDLLPLLPVFFSYILSFIYIGIYWSNHHHMLQIAKEVNGKILWANSHLLFWLSLIPFATAWSGENHFAPMPVAFYGFVFLMCSIAYFILGTALVQHHGKDSKIGRAFGKDLKGKTTLGINLVAITIATVLPYVALGLYSLVALVWIVPDKRMEKAAEIEA
jgi:uncharacterized membrane protein